MAGNKMKETAGKLLRVLLVGVGVSVLLAMPGPAQGVTKFKMSLPWLPDGQFNLAFVAKEKGFFRKHGLDVSIANLKGSGAAVNALGGGHYDAVIADMGVMVIGVGRGFDILSLGVIQHKSPAGVTALAGKGIEKPKDLEGRSYVTQAGSGEFAVWPAFVKAAGIDVGKVKITFAEPRVWDAMLLEGKADVRGSYYCAVAPGYWARGIKFKQILFADYGLEMYSLSAVVQRKTLSENPEALRAFITALFEGLKYTYLHPDESVGLHLKAVPDYKDTPVNRQMIRHGLGCTAALGLVETARERGLGWMAPRSVESTIDKVATYMKLKKRPPAERVYTNRFAGVVKLTGAEWKEALANHQKYIRAE